MGRLRLPVRHGRRHRATSIGAIAALAGLLLAPAVVAAHPLGNYTINHYAEVRVEADRVLLDVVIDQAEIPTFQARQDFDLDSDGSLSDDEIDAGRLAGCKAMTASIDLTADGVALELDPLEAGLSFPPGVGGLSTMRQTCVYEALLATPIGGKGSDIRFTDRGFPERLGWREIVASASGVTLTATDGVLRRASVSQRLSSYPPDLIVAPLADRQLAVSAAPGGPTLPFLDVPDADPIPGAVPAPSAVPASPSTSVLVTPVPVTLVPAVPIPGAVPGGISGADLPAIFRAADLTPLVILLSLLTAAGLGAAHALTPGHGKTLMAAYLVGTRGGALHALGLGLSVSISHTAGILVLAGVVVGFSDLVAPDVVVRWAPIVASVSIVLIGGWMLVNEVRRRRSRTHAQAHGHDHVDHEHHHVHNDERGHDHAHGGVAHSHAPASGSAITWRSLFLLGLAGGLIPSTSALLILLGSIAAGRPAFGFVLVLAFGLGMAAVMAGIGLVLVAARHRVERVELGAGLARLRAGVPLLASMVVLSFGLYLTAQALGGPPTL